VKARESGIEGNDVAVDVGDNADLHGCEAVPFEHFVVRERGTASANLGDGLVGEADVFCVLGGQPSRSSVSAGQALIGAPPSGLEPRL